MLLDKAAQATERNCKLLRLPCQIVKTTKNHRYLAWSAAAGQDRTSDLDQSLHYHLPQRHLDKAI